MGKSKIEWTGETWQVTNGCRSYSPGCANCYAEVMSVRLAGMALADISNGKDPGRKENYLHVIQDGGWKGNVVHINAALADPFNWKKPRTVFVNSMSDLFYGDDADRRFCKAKGIPFEPVSFDFIGQVFAVMALNPQHTFQILTKRTARMAEYFNAPIPLSTRADCVAGMHPTRINGKLFAWGEPMKSWERGATDPYDRRQWPGWPLQNVWIGTSVENQATADERIPHLLKIPAAVRFISAEPLLGPVDFSEWIGYKPNDIENRTRPSLDQIIVGGESGPHARPMHPDWARSIRNQCVAAGVPFFFKQWGEYSACAMVGDASGCFIEDHWQTEIPYNPAGTHFTGVRSLKSPDDPQKCCCLMARVGKKNAGRLLDGRTWDELPAQNKTTGV
jgi:protein gp37